MVERKDYKDESIKLIMKRVMFSEGYQQKFILSAKKILKIEWKDFAKKLGINESTLSKSYSFELSSLPYEVFKKIAFMIGEKEEEILKEYKCAIIEQEKIIGRKMIGESKKKIEKINIEFTNNNLKLDSSKVDYSKIDTQKDIKLPAQITPELAEEIGMHLGDGFLSSKKYNYRLKGNQNTEREYYINYIAPLYKKLYDINVKLKDYKTSFGFEISSKAIWEFKTKVLGIESGRKDNISIPEIVKVDNEKILTSLLRGIFDTDGCISFKTKYGYQKYYPVIEIRLLSKKLINDISEILFMLGFKPAVYLKGEYGAIYLSGISTLNRYEELIGWRSPKNLNKVNQWKKDYSWLSTWRLSSNG